MHSENSLKTISFITQGCRVNQAETASLSNELEQAGYKIVNHNDPADITIINTCTVTENGDTDTRKIINRVKRLNPKIKIALIGCLAQIKQDELLEIDNVEWVIGNAAKFKLTDILTQTTTNKLMIAPKISNNSFKINTPPLDRSRTRANVKIQDGCNNYCAYCVIPFARGPVRSRDFDNLMSEIKILAENKTKEIVLTGINTGLYQNNGKNIDQVIEAICHKTTIERIRISSIEPDLVSANLINLLQKPKFCHFLHIPIQSGQDDILIKMNRKFLTKEIKSLFNKIITIAPDTCIGTDVIVGFPGETEVQFNQTLEFLNSLPVAYIHVFSYSDRKNTKSINFPNKVSTVIKQERSQKLRLLSNKKRTIFLKQFLDTEKEVLFEQEKKGYWTGITDNFIRVLVKSDKPLKNTIQLVKLEQIKNDKILGSLK